MNIGKRIVEIVISAKDDTKGAFGGLAKRLAELTKEFPALSVLGGMALGKITEGFANAGRAALQAWSSTVKYADGLDEASQRIRESTANIEAWDYALTRNGSSVGDYESAITKLRMSLYHLNSGSQEMVLAFAELGVSARDISGAMRPAQDILLDIGDVLKTADENSQQFAASQAILGKSSQAFVATLKGGRDAFEESQRALRALNGEMSGGFVRSAAALSDSQDDLRVAWRGLVADVSEPINWAVALATNDAARAIAAIGNELDDMSQKIGDFKLFVDQGGTRAQESKKWAEREAHDAAVQFTENLEREAKRLGVNMTSPLFDPQSGTWIDSKREVDDIISDLTAAMTAPEKKEEIKKAFDKLAAGSVAKPEIVMDPVLVINSPDKTKQSMFDLLNETRLSAEDLERMAFDYGPPVEAIDNTKELTDAQYELAMAASNTADALGDVAAEGLTAFLMGTSQGMKFGTMIRTVVMSAIADLIVKLTVVKGLMSLFSGIGILGLSQGGRVPAMALGGTIPRAALGYAVPDGPRGMDSRLIAAMPGEEVISRQLSQKLDRFLSSMEFGAAVSPFALSGAGGGRGNVIVNFEVGRPVGVLDALSYGEVAATAARKAAEANL